MFERMKRWCSALTASVLVLAMAPGAFADDTVVLKDGTRVQGEIVREVSGAVWLKMMVGGVERTEFYAPNQIQEILRDTGDEPEPETPLNRRESASESNARDTGAPRVAVITLEGMVGTYFAAKPMQEAVELLEEEDIDIVVFKVNSGGGALIEIEPMQRTIIEMYKPRFQVVAWIESAISAAAMTSHVIEDIYFMDQGNYGACTGFFGASLVAMDGRDLEQVLYDMERMSDEGGKDPKIMRSMQIDEPLSASIDEYGEVTWYQNEDGDYLVNPDGQILTFNSQNAEKFGFSRGTVNTLDELVQAMGYPEYELVGEFDPALIHPVSKAEKHMREWREGIKNGEQRLIEYMIKYDLSKANAEAAQDRRERGTFIGRARRELGQILRVLDKHPNLALFQLGALPEQIDEWEYNERRILDELARRD